MQATITTATETLYFLDGELVKSVRNENTFKKVVDIPFKIK